MKILSRIAFMALVLVVSVSCGDDDDGVITLPQDQTTFEIISNSPNHTVLEQALIDTGLDQVLNSGTFTVFAPTDNAFSNVDLAGVTTEVLRNILLNHVVIGNVPSANLSTGYIQTNAVETYSGDDNNINLYVDISNGVVLNGVSTVSQADLSGTNGTVHVVDTVIVLPTVATIATADPNFSTLATALTQENLIGILSGDGAPAPFTVFAPTNNAFGNFLAGYESLETADDLLGLSTLSDILAYHVLSGAVRSGDIVDGSMPETFQGGTITLNTTGGLTITDELQRVVDIVATNVTTANGVIHVLNNVIVPNTAVNTTFDIIANSPDHTVLEQVLTDLGLVGVINSSTFTIFAPTDTAFANIDISGLTPEQVTNVVLNHALAGNFTSSDLSNGYVKTNATETYSGDGNRIDLYINTDNGVVLNGNAAVSQANLEAFNGTVHVVDAVITIPDVIDLAAANPEFSNLETALTQENLIDVLKTAPGTSPAPFTVFAPDNAAFQNFLTESNGFDTIQDVLDFAQLSDVLTYHVIGDSAVRANDITDGIEPATIQGDTFLINTTDGVKITDQADRVTDVIATDVTGSNGVIHVINNVILPTLD